MTHRLFEIWDCQEQPRPWRAQMKNYVAQFETEEQAKRYVAAIQKIEEDAKRRANVTRNKS